MSQLTSTRIRRCTVATIETCRIADSWKFHDSVCEQCSKTRKAFLTCLTGTAIPWTSAEGDTHKSIFFEQYDKNFTSCKYLVPYTCRCFGNMRHKQVLYMLHRSYSNTEYFHKKLRIDDFSFYHCDVHVHVFGAVQVPLFWHRLVQLAEAHVEPCLFRPSISVVKS